LCDSVAEGSNTLPSENIASSSSNYLNSKIESRVDNLNNPKLKISVPGS